LLSSVNPIDEDLLDKEKQSLIEYIEQNGLNRIDQYFLYRLRRWEQCALNIAVTGQSGAGKSSFINAIRGVTRTSPDFAPTDYIECICSPKAYYHPIHRNLAFWDLPGKDRILENRDFRMI
jgi:predicted GTPase